ncbi:hypothetical protein GW17_00004247 [Ensete ventricosum]|nr:hypothetical protein GW17_00004247 [Ensete ventricosum]
MTGMGGIGKTTLAQKIFNDSRIIDNYEIRLWVCVFQKVYSEIDLLKSNDKRSRDRLWESN